MSRALCPIVLLTMVAILVGCGSSGQATKEDPFGIISYNVVLRPGADPVMSLCDPGRQIFSIETSIRPVLLPVYSSGDTLIRVVAVCDPAVPPVTYEFPYRRVQVVMETSSPRRPPDSVADLTLYLPSCRQRDGIGPFDKLELRLVGGYRGDKDSIFYPSASGGEIYRSETFGNTRGGSSFLAGFEVAGYWSFGWLDPTGRLQLGIMSGWWPLDESHFIPIGVRARYTVDQVITEYGTNGSTLYFFGEAGVPIDFASEAPILGNALDRQRFFYGAGVGYDWPLGCDLDFSIDLALRRFTLPLPPIDCCPDVPLADRNPYRTSNAVLLRVGVTW